MLCPSVPAAYLVLVKEGRVLLLRRYQTGYEDGQYSLVAGHVEPGESFTDCMVREAEEEAGIQLERKDLRVGHVMHRYAPESEAPFRLDIFFIAERWAGEICNKEPHKCDELAWFELEKLPENLIPFVREALANIQQKKSYSEWGWNHL